MTQQTKKTENAKTQLTGEEVLNRLPEINKIKDKKLREQVVDVFVQHCPEYFWEVPASSTGKYHPEDTVGEHGLWIHVKRSVTAFERVASTYTETGYLTEQDVDYGIAGLLLHDMFKQGIPPRDEHHTKNNHDTIAYNYLKRKTDLPEEVLECIYSHNGGWGDGKEPETDLEQVHHIADMVSSDKKTFIKLEQPVPEKLKDKTIFSNN